MSLQLVVLVRMGQCGKATLYGGGADSREWGKAGSLAEKTLDIEQRHRSRSNDADTVSCVLCLHGPWQEEEKANNNGVKV